MTKPVDEPAAIRAEKAVPVADLGNAADLTTKPRAHWMDTLRGSAIVLVILWHSAAILPLYDYPAPTYLLRFNEFFASYRMPTLMLLSGMLLAQSLAKPLPTYAAGKARRILWPLLLWGLFYYTIHDHTTQVWQKVNWTTPYLWFLFYILVFYAVAPFLRFLPTVVLVGVPFVMTHVPGLTEDERRFYFLAGFFFLGALITEHRDRFDAVVRSPRTWLLAVAVVPFSLVFATAGPWRYWGALAAFSVAGILLAVKLAQLPGVQARTPALRFVGRDSIVYYCSHFPVLMGVVRLSEHLSLPVVVVLPAGFVAALAVGTGLSLAARSQVVSWAFIAPFGRTFGSRHRTGPVGGLIEARSPQPAVAAAQVAMSAAALIALMVFGQRII